MMTPRPRITTSEDEVAVMTGSKCGVGAAGVTRRLEGLEKKFMVDE